jgi:DNA-binding MarR family transcriptional regulator
MADHLYFVFAIHRMTHEIAVALERASLGVNQPEAHILAHLAENGASTVADIHRTFGHKRSTLTSILDRLESRQLVERVINASDRRSFVVRLTNSGASVAGEVRTWLQALEADMAAQLNEEQLAAFDAFATVVRNATQSR